MAIIQLPADFKEFLRLLQDHKVKYLLIGGYAVAYHGYPRATGDIDFLIQRSPKNAKNITDAIISFGFNLPNLKPEIFLKDNQITSMGNEPMKIEIFTNISGVEFDECFTKADIWKYEDLEIPVIDLESLKINKKANGRNQDLGDLDNLP